MKLVIFGLSVSSSWGNGHATLWRGLCGALSQRGHRVVFFERDVPYYANTRDLFELPGSGDLVLYSEWAEALPAARAHLRDADVAITTSYCPDAVAASDLAMESGRPLRVFYDLDTPVTLARLEAGEAVDYIGPRGLADFDLVLSYTGGRSLDELRERLGARAVAPLYGSVDPKIHRPVQHDPRYCADLGYLGTFARDRSEVLRALFLEPARRLSDRKFVLAGAMYDEQFPWLPNVFFVNHLPPADHPAFYCSTKLALNVTRHAMARTGYCPSGRLFEATACGAAVLSDAWEGIGEFFEPGREILLAGNTEDAMAALDRSPEDLVRIAARARERTLAQHTADVRAGELEQILTRASEYRDSERHPKHVEMSLDPAGRSARATSEVA
ncbi:MAG TPA: glycosyltransferase [Bryobacteraceae bacterium]|nr:glycosyltransferase [Bryobacteraceae bacterium]